MSDYDPEIDPDRAPDYYEPPRTPFWRRPLVLGAVTAIVVLGVIAGVAYRRGEERGEKRVPPVVQAEQGPAKVAPEQPGGMEVPHQDKLIYGRISGHDQKEPVEQLLPGPEEPVAKPAPKPEPKAAQAPAGGMTAAPGTTSAQATGPGAPPTSLQPPAAAEAPAPPAAKAPPAQIGPRLSQLLQHVQKEPGSTAGQQRVAALEQPAPSMSSAAGGNGFVVQLGAMRNEAAAQAEWDRLVRKMPDLLGPRRPTAKRVQLGARGTFYRLQTGPFADRTAAVSLCEQVKARGQNCMVVGP